MFKRRRYTGEAVVNSSSAAKSVRRHRLTWPLRASPQRQLEKQIERDRQELVERLHREREEQNKLDAQLSHDLEEAVTQRGGGLTKLEKELRKKVKKAEGTGKATTFRQRRRRRYAG